MSEEASDAAKAGTENTAQGGDNAKDGQFTPITSQEEMNRIVTARLNRQASKFADYDELKAKAEKFDQAAEASKSELQKAVERAEAAEKKLGTAEAEKQRLAVIAKHQIPESLQDLVRGDSAEQLEAAAAKLAELAPSAPRGPISPTEGLQPEHQSHGSSDWLRDEFLNH